MRLPFYLLVVLLISCSSHKTPEVQTVVVSKPTSANIISKSWIGEWQRQLWQNDASLEIKSIKGDSIEFTMQAVSGGHSGEVEGMAIVKDIIATFFDKEDDDDSCLLTFTLHGDSIITIKQKMGSCFAGAGVWYDGEYRNTKVAPLPAKSETLLDLGIFKNEKEDSVFKSLVGSYYSLFVSSTDLTSEDDDLDSLKANVQSSGVRGFLP